MVIRCRKVELMHPTSGLIQLCSGQIADSERVVCWQAGRALAARSPTYVFLR
jgi:hypothetical protein